MRELEREVSLATLAAVRHLAGAQALEPSPNAVRASGAHVRPVPVTNGIARCRRQRLPSDPMQQIDLLLLEDLMLRKKANPINLGRALETASILVVLFCLLGASDPRHRGEHNRRGGAAAAGPRAVVRGRRGAGAVTSFLEEKRGPRDGASCGLIPAYASRRGAIGSHAVEATS